MKLCLHGFQLHLGYEVSHLGSTVFHLDNCVLLASCNAFANTEAFWEACATRLSASKASCEATPTLASNALEASTTALSSSNASSASLVSCSNSCTRFAMLSHILLTHLSKHSAKVLSYKSQVWEILLERLADLHSSSVNSSYYNSGEKSRSMPSRVDRHTWHKCATNVHRQVLEAF